MDGLRGSGDAGRHVPCRTVSDRTKAPTEIRELHALGLDTVADFDFFVIANLRPRFGVVVI